MTEKTVNSFCPFEKNLRCVEKKMEIPYALPQYHDVDELVPGLRPLPRGPSQPREVVHDTGLIRHRLSGRFLVLCRRRPMYGYDEAKATFVHLGTGQEHKERLASLRYTQGSVVIAHGSVKHGSLSCAKRQGATVSPRNVAARGRLTQGSFRRRASRACCRRARGGWPWTGEHGSSSTATELEGLSKGGKAGNRARQLPRAVAGRVLRASLQVTIVLPKAPAQIDGRPDVRSAANGAPQTVDGERSGLAGRCPGLVERHLALALKFFIAAPQPRNFKASPRVNFVGWVHGTKPSLSTGTP